MSTVTYGTFFSPMYMINHANDDLIVKLNQFFVLAFMEPRIRTIAKYNKGPYVTISPTQLQRIKRDILMEPPVATAVYRGRPVIENPLPITWVGHSLSVCSRSECKMECVCTGSARTSSKVPGTVFLRPEGKSTVETYRKSLAITEMGKIILEHINGFWAMVGPVETMQNLAHLLNICQRSARKSKAFKVSIRTHHLPATAGRASRTYDMGYISVTTKRTSFSDIVSDFVEFFKTNYPESPYADFLKENHQDLVDMFNTDPSASTTSTTATSTTSNTTSVSDEDDDEDDEDDDEDDDGGDDESGYDSPLPTITPVNKRKPTTTPVSRHPNPNETSISERQRPTLTKFSTRSQTTVTTVSKGLAPRIIPKTHRRRESNRYFDISIELTNEDQPRLNQLPAARPQSQPQPPTQELVSEQPHDQGFQQSTCSNISPATGLNSEAFASLLMFAVRAAQLNAANIPIVNHTDGDVPRSLVPSTGVEPTSAARPMPPAINSTVIQGTPLGSSMPSTGAEPTSADRPMPAAINSTVIQGTPLSPSMPSTGAEPTSADRPVPSTIASTVIQGAPLGPSAPSTAAEPTSTDRHMPPAIIQGSSLDLSVPSTATEFTSTARHVPPAIASAVIPEAPLGGREDAMAEKRPIVNDRDQADMPPAKVRKTDANGTGDEESIATLENTGLSPYQQWSDDGKKLTICLVKNPCYSYSGECVFISGAYHAQIQVTTRIPMDDGTMGEETHKKIRIKLLQNSKCTAVQHDRHALIRVIFEPNTFGPVN